jgi:anti-anti-sigma regulatory factor
MLTVNKKQSKSGLLVELSGAIEENVHFEQLIGNFEGDLSVNCRGVTRINSVGVKTWIRYFQNLKLQGKVFQFVEVSYPLIEQLNMISNFAAGGEVESILLPFSCIKCQNEFVASCKTAELKAHQLKIPRVKCEKTDCAALFDDDPEEYLYFLQD